MSAAYRSAIDATVRQSDHPYTLLTDESSELGHTVRACPEEAMEITDRVEVKCVNCEAVGHRARDCPEPRKDRFACRNCK